MELIYIFLGLKDDVQDLSKKAVSQVVEIFEGFTDKDRGIRDQQYKEIMNSIADTKRAIMASLWKARVKIDSSGKPTGDDIVRAYFQHKKQNPRDGLRLIQERERKRCN